MSYKTVTQSSNDQALRDRIQAAVSQEAWNNPDNADSDYATNVQASTANFQVMIWPVVSATDVEAAYASAVAAENPDPGGDESVITDGMILSSVQANWPENPWPPVTA